MILGLVGRGKRTSGESCRPGSNQMAITAFDSVGMAALLG